MAETVKDPVCGMELDAREATNMVEHESRTYSFCSPGCKAAFVQDPQRYLTP